MHIYASNPGHTCVGFVSMGTAAKTVDVPYQYVHGLVKRAFKAKRPSVSARRIEPKSEYDQPRWEVCLDCIKSKYGDKKTLQTELRVSPIQAYRAWNIADCVLLGWYKGDFVWLPEGVQATCTKCSEVPGVRHQCGLYAVKEPDSPAIPYGGVLGAVELWGRYIEADDGFRAEWGKPVALLCDDYKQADRIHRVAQAYDIPVVHKVAQLKTDWGERFRLEHQLGKDEGNGYRDGEEDRRSTTSTGTGTRAASCRDAARGASSIEQLKFLVQEGVISKSNVTELFGD